MKRTITNFIRVAAVLVFFTGFGGCYTESCVNPIAPSSKAAKTQNQEAIPDSSSSAIDADAAQ